MNFRPEPTLRPKPSRGTRHHLIRLRPLGVRYFPFVFGEEDKVISKQLEPGTVLESAPPRLGYAIEFNEILSKTKRLSFPRQGEGKKSKAHWPGHALGMALTTGAQMTPTSRWCILTTTSDLSYASPSGYNAVVTRSLWSPEASIAMYMISLRVGGRTGVTEVRM